MAVTYEDLRKVLVKILEEDDYESLNKNIIILFPNGEEAEIKDINLTIQHKDFICGKKSLTITLIN